MQKLIQTLPLFLLFVFCFSFTGEALSPAAPYFTTSDQAEYEKFLEENTVTEDFVRYEDVAFLGDFAGLEVQMPESLQYASMYSYEIRGAGQSVLNLYVSKGPLPSTDLYRTDKISDLRNFWVADRPLVIQDVWFYYSRKNLHKIVWKNGNILFTLTGELGAYPRVEGDFISDLLNGETVEEMILVLHGEKEYVRSTETIPGDSSDEGSLADGDAFTGADAVPYLFVQTEEAYNQFIREGNLPKPFLFYEDLSFLGAFEALQIPNEEMDHYRYWFYNENGLSLGFNSERELPAYWGDEVSPPDGDFLQNVHAEEYFVNSKKVNVRCHCRVGNFLFVYTKMSDGCVRLTNINWFNEENGKGFGLDGLKELDSSKPLTGFLGDLLSAERSEAARNQLYDLTVHGKKINVDSSTDTPDTTGSDTIPSAPTPFPWLWVILPAGAVLIIAATAVLFIRKKKTR